MHQNRACGCDFSTPLRARCQNSLFGLDRVTRLEMACFTAVHIIAVPTPFLPGVERKVLNYILSFLCDKLQMAHVLDRVANVRYLTV